MRKKDWNAYAVVDRLAKRRPSAEGCGGVMRYAVIAARMPGDVRRGTPHRHRPAAETEGEWGHRSHVRGGLPARREVAAARGAAGAGAPALPSRVLRPVQVELDRGTGGPFVWSRLHFRCAEVCVEFGLGIHQLLGLSFGSIW